MKAQNKEKFHQDVYGETFALYNKQDMLDFIRPLEIRYERNKIDPKVAFAGKHCLDAGCGNGRGSIFMCSNGASHVDCVDISPMNIQSTLNNAQVFGFKDKIHGHESTLEKIPFDDNTFDFVWCNGVVMHTHNPDKCLSELARVLKPGGKAWIYVYGSGGVYWYSVYKAREILKQYSEKQILETLQFLLTPTSYIAEYMDDWKAPYLRSYTDADFSGRLQSLGFKDAKPLPYGTDYDTSHRINTFKGDKDYLGEGDLRYFITKQPGGEPQAAVIKDGEFGSDYTYADQYKKPLDEKFGAVEKLLSGKGLMAKVATLAYLQRGLRDSIFASNKPFDLQAYLASFDATAQALKNDQ